MSSNASLEQWMFAEATGRTYTVSELGTNDSEVADRRKYLNSLNMINSHDNIIDHYLSVHGKYP